MQKLNTNNNKVKDKEVDTNNKGKKEMSKEEELLNAKNNLKKVGSIKTGDESRENNDVNNNKKKKITGSDILKQQIQLRFKNLRMHDDEQSDDDSSSDGD